MKNKDKLIAYFKYRLYRKHKLNKIYESYKMLGYSDVEAFVKIWEYLRKNKKYALFISFRRILIELGYYRKLTKIELTNEIKRNNGKVLFKDKFDYYTADKPFSEWLNEDV